VKQIGDATDSILVLMMLYHQGSSGQTKYDGMADFDAVVANHGQPTGQTSSETIGLGW
jgi:hypothetical protein